VRRRHRLAQQDAACRALVAGPALPLLAEEVLVSIVRLSGRAPSTIRQRGKCSLGRVGEPPRAAPPLAAASFLPPRPWRRSPGGTTRIDPHPGARHRRPPPACRCVSGVACRRRRSRPALPRSKGPPAPPSRQGRSTSIACAAPGRLRRERSDRGGSTLTSTGSSAKATARQGWPGEWVSTSAHLSPPGTGPRVPSACPNEHGLGVTSGQPRSTRHAAPTWSEPMSRAGTLGLRCFPSLRFSSQDCLVPACLDDRMGQTSPPESRLDAFLEVI
jgi:hypothetical protein